jgi:hypothetical protein
MQNSLAMENVREFSLIRKALSQIIEVSKGGALSWVI